MHKSLTIIRQHAESDLEQRLVSWFSEPLNLPLGPSAGSLPCDLELTHSSNPLQSVLEFLLADVH